MLPDRRIAIAILAGGYGTRLWPLSTRTRPKQFVPILPEGSVLQATYARARRTAEPDQILIVGNREHEDLYREQLPELPAENLILEPTGLGTAPCLGLTAALAAEEARFDAIVAVPVDHVVTNPDEWSAAITTAVTHVLNHDELVSIAAVPTSPEVKFGYLVIGDRIGGTHQQPVFNVRRFLEKPDADTLASLLADEACLRNMGMLAFKPGTLLGELSAYVPEIAEPLERARASGLTQAAANEAYSMMPKASIDAEVLQKTRRLAVVRTTIDSIDAGDFATLGDVLEADEDGNRIRGMVISVDATGNTVVSDDSRVALVGVRDLVIVVDGETVLVCPKDQTQRIREAAD